MTDPAQTAVAAVSAELRWLGALIDSRLRAFLSDAPHDPPPPPAPAAGSPLAEIVAQAPLDADARVVLALALAPALDAAALDPFFVRNAALERPFTEFGGAYAASQGGFRPTVETALFLIGGRELSGRVRAARLFAPDHPLRRQGLVALETGGEAGAADPRLTAPADAVAHLTTGRPSRPDLSPDFPARRLTTALDWDDLVQAPEVLDELEHILAWVANERRLMDDWGLRRSLTPGYRALFYGPPGTGKTLAATLLGKRVGQDVYRIDLSMVVSKYIGETEKNLAGVFDRAESRHWVLFFDEADALFGARTAASSANERHANQEVAYLLQRIEACPALVILATNLRGALDDAFNRRFQSMIGFRKPTAAQRRRLWGHVTGGGMPLAEDVDLDALAAAHPLVGGAIVNVARHAGVLALRRGREVVTRADIEAGVVAEMRKEGRTP